MVSNNYRSGFEELIAKDLTKNGVKFQYEAVIVPYRLDLEYNPDFLLDNGIFVETKGLFDGDDRRKMLAVKSQHPEKDIRLVFMQDNRIRKGSKVRYSDWCKKNGFKYAFNRIPKQWMEENRNAL